MRISGFSPLLETLEVPPSQAELFAVILDCAQVVACMDDSNRRVRIDRLGHAKEVDVGGKPTRVTGPDWLTGEVEALLVSD